MKRSSVVPVPKPSQRVASPPAIAFLWVGIAFLLVGLQAPPPNSTGSGDIEVVVTTLEGVPISGLVVRYLDEWQRQPYGECATDAGGTCLLTVKNAPALNHMLRGLLDTGAARKRDAVVPAGERVRIEIRVDPSGNVVAGGTDILATRDPNMTPTLISPEAAFATLTAVNGERIATPSPGIELTVAAAHAGMTATASARPVRASVTPASAFTPTSTGTGDTGIAQAGAGAPTPASTTMTEESAIAAVEPTPVPWLPVAATALIALVVLVLIRRHRAGGGA